MFKMTTMFEYINLSKVWNVVRRKTMLINIKNIRLYSNIRIEARYGMWLEEKLC